MPEEERRDPEELYNPTTLGDLKIFYPEVMHYFKVKLVAAMRICWIANY